MLCYLASDTPSAGAAAGRPLPEGFEPFFFLWGIGATAAIYLFHRHWLIRRGVAARFLKLWEEIEIADRAWIKGLTLASLALLAVVLVSAMAWLVPEVPIQVLDANSLR
jgi:hypothetical protein